MGALCALLLPRAFEVATCECTSPCGGCDEEAPELRGVAVCSVAFSRCSAQASSSAATVSSEWCGVTTCACRLASVRLASSIRRAMSSGLSCP